MPPTQLSAGHSPVPGPGPTGLPVTRQAPTHVALEESPPACEDWQAWPVIPTLGKNILVIYSDGLETRNDPRAFSKIGDGEIAADWFLSVFDLSPEYFDLGAHEELQAVIQYFSGSFGRRGMAARRGFNTNSILDPAARDQTMCNSGETPLDCELRLHRPAFAILSLGTNQAWRPEEFEGGMRQILDVLLRNNVVPILSTKGDNVEGDHRVNHIIACLAVEYEVPLWNFWAAIQSLPDHGLQPDLEHLTYGIADFDDARAMQSAWTVRNLTALQTLDAVWRQVTNAQCCAGGHQP